MNPKRIQLTLFLAPHDAQTIEQIRRQYNPAQFELIAAHVTLCREDELENLEKVLANLTRLRHGPLTLDFEKVARFSEGKGVFIPASQENAAFQELRRQILHGVVENPRLQEPHITLMHPRNSTCTDALFSEIEKYPVPRQIHFRKISLIEQEIGKKWATLQEFDLI